MNIIDSSKELLQCFDERGNPTEARTRAEVKVEPPWFWYATARTWLVNDNGQLMVSRRSDHVAGNPDKWQTYFGGHVGAGMSLKEAARQELLEESGIDRRIEDLHLMDKGRKDDKKVFYENYAVRFNGQPTDLTFPDGEVTEAKWMDMNEYWKEKEDHPDNWCNSCSLEQQQLIKEWLES